DAVADPPSLAASLRALGFGFGAAFSVEDAAAVADAPSLPPSFAADDLGFGFGAAREAAALVVDASSLAVGLIGTVFFFSGFDSVAACAPGAGGLVPV